VRCPCQPNRRFFFAAREEPQALDRLKSPLFVPEIIIFDKVNSAVPTFFSVARLARRLFFWLGLET
jgi:hypothetical protein